MRKIHLTRIRFLLMEIFILNLSKGPVNKFDFDRGRDHNTFYVVKETQAESDLDHSAEQYVGGVVLERKIDKKVSSAFCSRKVFRNFY